MLKPLDRFGATRSGDCGKGTPTLGKLDSFAATDIGRRRENNEDQFLIADLARTAKVNSTSLSHHDGEQIVGRSHAKLLLVADGMGGHAAGQRASMLAADTALNSVLDRFPWVSDDRPSEEVVTFGTSTSTQGRVTDETREQVVAGLHSVVQQCQKAVLDDAAWNPSRRGMGTTLTMALVDWPTAYVAHVGDSRCYVCRNGKLHQLTVDHTYANALVESGEMTPEEATHSSFAHAIWNVVGGHDAQIEPSVEVHQLEIGDTLLLCSDGLTNHVDDETLCDVISTSGSAEQACERLIALANAGGGRDNITLAVARFVDASVLEAQESAADGEVDGQLDPIDLEAAELDFTLSESTIQFLDNSDV